MWHAQDYNTATFPSEKYYDVDKWEMDAFRKQQENERFKKMREAGTFNDEQELAAERKKEREKQVRHGGGGGGGGGGAAGMEGA